MELAVSSVVLLCIFVAILIAERGVSRRSKDVHEKNDEKIQALAQHTHARYVAKHGKDPTQELPIHDPEHKGT